MSLLARQGWTRSDLLVLVALLAGALAATGSAWIDIAMRAWRDEESSYILLVLPIAVWLFWVRRARLRLCRPSRRWIGPIVIAAGLLLHSWGWAVGVDIAWHGGAVLTAIGALLSITGPSVVHRFAAAFIALMMLVPVPGIIRTAVAIPLQSATARVTQFMLDILGVVTERSGNIVIVDGVPIAVAEACNGMRMVFALFLVMYAFAFSLPLRNSMRLLLLLACPIVAICANVARLVPTVLAFAKFPEQTAAILHDLSGWVMLAAAFLALLGIERSLRWALIPTQRFTLARRVA